MYGDNKIAVIPAQEPTLPLVQRAAREQLHDQATGKLLCAIGGLEDRDTGRYLKLPVLAVCSRQSRRRQNDDDDSSSASDAAIDDRGITVDLHTSECPIKITAHNKDIDLAAAGLHGCPVNGVLTIFAVQRVFSTTDCQGSGTYFTQTLLHWCRNS